MKFRVLMGLVLISCAFASVSSFCAGVRSEPLPRSGYSAGSGRRVPEYCNRAWAVCIVVFSGLDARCSGCS